MGMEREGKWDQWRPAEKFFRHSKAHRMQQNLPLHSSARQTKKYFLLSYIKPCGCKWIWKIGLFPLDIQAGGNKTISCNCYNDCSVTGGFLNAVFIQVHLKEHMELRDWCCGDTNYTGATYKSEWCCPEIMKFWLKTRSRLGKKLHFDKFLLLGRLKSFFLRLKSYIHKLVLQPLHIQLLHTLN